MTWDSSAAGLGFTTSAANFTTLPTNTVAVSGTGFDLGGFGGPPDARVDASFSFDDTQYGWVPDGIFKVTASCALAGLGSGARFVQLRMKPVSLLGVPANSLSSDMPGEDDGGAVTGFSASIPALGTLDLADEAQSASIGGAYLLSGHLPWTVHTQASNPTNVPPDGFLLRPSALTWRGQNPANDANFTVFRFDELDVVSWTLAVNAAGVVMPQVYEAIGLL